MGGSPGKTCELDDGQAVGAQRALAYGSCAIIDRVVSVMAPGGV
jgi:hypothetical protein